MMMKKISLFALPYAYGGANIYRNLNKYLYDYMEVIPLNYPGHESRFKEKLLSSIQDIAEDAYKQICNNIHGDYSLLGYSMGGYICYELYQIIKKNNKKLPLNLFILATNEPGYKYEHKNGEKMSLEMVKETLLKLGGTNEEILDNGDLIEVIAPIVRMDTYAIENYVPTNNITGKISCPVTIIRGADEDHENCYVEWNKYFVNECEYIVVDGDHFFMFEDDGKRIEEFAEIINKRINRFYYTNIIPPN